MCAVCWLCIVCMLYVACVVCMLYVCCMHPCCVCCVRTPSGRADGVVDDMTQWTSHSQEEDQQDDANRVCCVASYSLTYTHTTQYIPLSQGKDRMGEPVPLDHSSFGI